MPKKKFEDWDDSDKKLMSGFVLGIVVGIWAGLVGLCIVSAVIYGVLTNAMP